jgi:hypothetical protein
MPVQPGPALWPQACSAARVLAQPGRQPRRSSILSFAFSPSSPRRRPLLKLSDKLKEPIQVEYAGGDADLCGMSVKDNASRTTGR